MGKRHLHRQQHVAAGKVGVPGEIAAVDVAGAREGNSGVVYLGNNGGTSSVADASRRHRSGDVAVHADVPLVAQTFLFKLQNPFVFDTRAVPAAHPVAPARTVAFFAKPPVFADARALVGTPAFVTLVVVAELVAVVPVPVGHAPVAVGRLVKVRPADAHAGKARRLSVHVIGVAVVARLLGDVDQTGFHTKSGFGEHVLFTLVARLARPTRVALAVSTLVTGAVPVACARRRALDRALRPVPTVHALVDGAVPAGVARARAVELARAVPAAGRVFLAVAGFPLPLGVARTHPRVPARASAAADTQARASVLAVVPAGPVRARTVGGAVRDHARAYPAASVGTRVLAGYAGVPRSAVAVDGQVGGLALSRPAAKRTVVLGAFQRTPVHLVSGFVIKVALVALAGPRFVASAVARAVVACAAVFFGVGTAILWYRRVSS